jgi:peptidoglycan/LPS O-acetylase OafA/YrhL
MQKVEIRQDIQGLRAVAVLGVMIFHLNVDLLPGGFAGVDVFFVISGFIISNMILSNQNQFLWIDFYWGRIRRIVPVYLVVLSITTIIAAVIFLPSDFSHYWQSLKSALYFGSNYYFSNFGDYFAPKSSELPLLHTWSLGIEMQFYVFMPFLIVFLPLRFLNLVLGFLIVVGFSVIFFFARLPVNEGNLHFSLLARMPEFMLGMILATSGIMIKKESSYAAILTWVGILLILLAFVFSSKTNFFSGYVLLPCIGTCFLIVSRGVGFSFLSSRVMIWLGGLSFSLYLWHWPILSFIRYITQTYELTFLWSTVYWALSLVLSILSWHLIEQPCRKLQLSYKLLRASTTSILAIVFAPFVFANYVNAHSASILDENITRYADPATICHGKMIDECLRGKKGTKPLALVIGDSHAAQLNLFFDELGKSNDLSFKVITGSSCVPIKGFDVDRLPEYARQDCKKQITNVQTNLNERAEYKIIILASKWAYHLESKRFTEALNTFLKDTSQQGVKVFLLTQLPMIVGNPVRSDRLAKIGIKSQVLLSPKVSIANKKLTLLAKPYQNVTIIDYSPNQLFDTLPFFNEKLIYMDEHHLNEFGAVQYAKQIGSIFVKQLQN